MQSKKQLNFINLLPIISGLNIALYELAFRYENGFGIDENKFKAFELYKKSAENGFIPSQYELANCYKYGKGIEENKINALNWFKLYQKNDGNLDVSYDINYFEKESVKILLFFF